MNKGTAVRRGSRYAVLMQRDYVLTGCEYVRKIRSLSGYVYRYLVRNVHIYLGPLLAMHVWRLTLCDIWPCVTLDFGICIAPCKVCYVVPTKCYKGQGDHGKWSHTRHVGMEEKVRAGRDLSQTWTNSDFSVLFLGCSPLHPPFWGSRKKVGCWFFLHPLQSPLLTELEGCY